jgi:hypothetical protein
MGAAPNLTATVKRLTATSGPKERIMNDLTFGATLLSSFVALAAAVIFEISASPTHQHGAAPGTRAAPAAATAAKAAKGVTAATTAGDAACVTVALAPSPSR